MDTVFTDATKRTSVPFRHDVVGSFLRPAALKEARRKHEAGEITDEELRKVEDEEIIKLVQKEKEVGLKSVTDGEFRRSWWHLDFFWGLDGVERKILEKGYEFQGVKTRTDTAFITGKISCKVHPQVEHFKFLKKVAGDDVVARQNIPAPSQILFEFYRNEETIANTQHFYPNTEELYEDLANAWRNAILSFYEAGCRNLQLDDCTWGMLCDAKWREEILKVTDIPEFARGRVELNNRAIRDLPEDLTITMHTCRGNFKSTFFGTGGYQPVAETLFSRANVKAFYLEFDTERAGGFEPLQYLRDQLVVIGLFSSKLPALEDKEQIIARLKEATKYVDINRICISPQCGFASTEEGNLLTEEEQWNKLRFIKEVADQIWH